MAIHCMLLTGDNIRIVQNFLSEFKDKYDCMQTFDMVRSMISAWQSANFKDGEEPTMPTKDEIEKFIQSQLSKDKQSSVAPVRSTNIADYVNTEGKDKGFLTEKGEELLSTTFDKSKFNKGTNKVSIYPGVNGTEIRIDWTSPRTGNSASVIYYGSSTRKVWDLFNSKGGNVTDITSDIYWDALNKIIPNSLRELVESGKYNELDTTAIETDTKTLIVKKTALEDYFEKEYNVFKQGRNLDYNTKQINKALSSVQEYNNEEQSIIDKAKKNGTFMKAPNGKPTNLTEKQWVQVRTKAFKDWFGDWEAEVRRKNRLEVIKPYIKNVVPIKKILPFIDSGLVNAENTPKNKLYTILTDFFNRLPISKELNVYYLDSKIRKDLPYYKNWTGYTSSDNIGFYIIDDSDKYQYNKIDSINSNISTFIHELTHALLMKSIGENKEFRNKVQNLYDYTIQYLKNTNIYDRYKDMYGFTDIHEFISEAVSNISFMRVLDDIPSPNKEKNSIFDDFLNAIKTLFKESRGGFAGKEHSILDDVFNLLNTDNFDIYEHNNVSKVVDENGEPLVVYHYTDNENLTEFSIEFDNYFSKTGGTKNAIFFTTDNVVPGSEDNFLTSRKAKLSLFLNIKNLEVFHGTKEDLHKQGTSYREIVNKSSERKNSENGIVFTGFDDNKKENQTVYVVHNPNQIKSAINNTGEFSKNSNNIYDIDSKETPIQEDNKSYAEDLARCARQMSPIERKHRVERITRMFSSIVNSKLKDKLTSYNDKIQAETNPKVKNDLLFGRKKITRFSVIKSEGVQSIMLEVRKAFQVYAEAPLEAKIAIEKKPIKDALINRQKKKGYSIDEEAIDRKATIMAKAVVERKDAAFKNVLNNFQVLAEEALGNLALTEGISVNLNSNFVLNTQENSDTFNEDGKQTNQGDVFEKEESLKDGWMTDVRQVATFDSLTARVRQAIGNMVRYDSTGNVDRDDLGDNIYLNAGYVHSELIQALRNMISAEDMIPMLEQLSKKKVWVKQIINELNNDNQLFTEFYRAYRKDYVNYFIQKVSTNSDTSTSTKVMSINGAEGTSHYFDEWRDNYEYGNVLTTDSIYDKNGDIQLKNAKVGLDLVNELLDIFEDRETIAENLTDENIARIKKAMNMLGASVDSETLENALKFNLDNKAFKPAVNVLLSNLRTIYYDLNKGNEKVKDGEYIDLLNIHGTAFNNIAEVINKVDEDTIESSVRQGDKTMYAHINPSYVTTLIKKLQREDTYKQVLDDYRVCNWFNKNGKWRNSILEEIENNAEVRSNLKHVVLLQYNRKEYNAWTDLDATLALYNMYMTGAADRSGSETYSYYQVPMLSDAQSAEFIKFKRYKKGYEEKLLDKFKDLVYQEIDRINLVKERATTDNHIDPIANFDMNGKKMGGAEFKFFPELNQKGQSGKTFLQAIDEAKQISMDEVDNLIKNTIKSIMDSRFKEAIQHYKDIGLYDRIGTEKNARFKHVNVYSEEGMNDRMREWFWNSTYFTSQFIELTTTDLAYYKNLEDFQKRNKQDHAPAERLNTLATWNDKPVLVNNDGSRRTTRRVIYLKDNILPANSMDSINEILEARVKDKNDAFTAYDKAAIMSIFNKVNVADAQAYNTLPSFRSTQIMAGMWFDAEETAYNNIMNNKWTASDFLVLWNTRKPYLYTQKNQPDGMGGIMKVPTQHKNSEFLLLTGAMFGQILHSSKLQALNDFMVKNNIDSAMFESAVKDGLQGTINLNDATNYASTIAVLENVTRLNGKENPNVVHEFDYNDYGIQTSTPEHGIDKVQLVGTQIRRLISSDMNPNRDPNFKLKYKDREFTQEEWMNYFNAINTANIQEAFKEVSDKFNDIHEVEKELIREVRSNPRYGTDLIRALTLDENGNFNIPLIDPSQTLRIQALLNSILKNRVTKQKINGGALIQASPFGLDESKQPQIVYNEDGSIKYFEAYLPCPTEELYNALLDPNTHELDINKKDSKGNYIVPEKYREVIGYRVPTEDKYSMQHIRIKGFLPRQVGSVIILPKEITSLAGSDYDVDKVYVMFHSLFTKNNYNIKKAWDDFYQLESSKDILEEIDKNYGEALQQYIAEQTEGEPLDSEDLNDLAEEFKGWLKDNNVKRYNLSETAQTRFSEWFNKNKSKYLINSSFSTYDYDFDKIKGNDKLSIYNNAKANSKKQRDSLMIDLMWSVLSHKDTAKSILEPGGFDKPKKAARINTILYNVDKETLTKLGGLKGLEKLSLDELDNLADKYKEKLNPLVPTTWVTLHQRNMSGASLIPMAATNNASHALMQQTKLGIKGEYQLTFNGHKYNSLHDIKNADNEFITRNIASFLAAFVDNAKDPIAGDMNFNEITASSAFALLRMGVGINTMSLIINQPIVRDIVKEVQNNRVSLAEAIINTINKYKNYNNGTNVNSYYTKIEDYNFKDEDLASNIIARKDADTANTSEGHEFYANQLKVGFMFARLNKLAGDLNEFTNATRADTQNGGAGPYISSDIINIEKVEKLLMAPIKDANYSLTGTLGLLSFNLNEEGIINSPLPILQAFFTYGVESTEKLFNKYFPYYNNTYTSIISTIKDMTRYGNLNEKQRNSIYNDFISYMLAETSEYNYKDEEGNPISERKYYITKFPAEFDAFKKAHPELSQLPIINRVKYNKFTKYNPAPSLTFSNVGRITDIQKQDYIRSWETLMNINDECRDMAIKLFLYCNYKGLGFSPNGFSHLAPVAVKENTGNYIETLEDMYFEKADVTTFIGQYFRNHLDDRTLVPDITGASYVSEVNLETENFDVKVDFNSSMDDKKIAKPFDDKSTPEYLPYVHINYKGADLYFERVNKAKDLIASYQRIQPLGVKNQYVEYDSNASEDMESVVPKPQAYKANLNDYVDNTDITDNQDMANFVMEQQQSAQASLLAVIKQKAAENGYTESQPIDKLEQLPPITEDEQGNKFCDNVIVSF